MNPATNPRSLLHALQPIGVGTPEVESLLSYFCRLSHSHSASTLSLARRVAELFEHDVEKYFMWHERKISGLRESALTWSSALSALTSVPDLDGLTFVRWRGAISQNGLSMVSKGQFCPVCLAQDKASGQTPYFRLAWESRAVSVCPQHRVPLTQCCPTCGKDNIRHAASFVVPGWCTKCGEFLGKPRDELPGNVCDAEQVWKAVQVGKLVAAQDRLVRTVDRQTLMDALTRIIDETDGGRPSTFASRVGIAKSTVHHWFEEGGVPTLDMSLKIALHCGVALPNLLQGNLVDWKAPVAGQQLALQFGKPSPRACAPARDIDWVEVEAELQRFLLEQPPIPVLEAAQRLDVEARQLYLRANKTARMLGERWKAHVKRRQAANIEAALPQLEAVARELAAEGRALTRREVSRRLSPEALSKVPRLFDVLRDVQAQSREKPG